MKPWLVILCILLSSCGTRQKTYVPPDSTRMDAARQRLSVSVDKATASAKRVREHTQAANVSAGRVVAYSGSVEVKLRGLHGRVTAELRPLVADIQNDVAMGKMEEAVLTDTLSKALTVEKALADELTQAQTDKVELSRESQVYAANAQKLADNATHERDERIKAEKALSWYRWHSWLLKIGTALAVLVIVGIAILWFTGGLAKLAAKFI